MSPQHNKINIFIFISISGAPNTQKNSSQFSIHVSRNTHTKYDYVCYIHFQVNNWIGWTWIDVNIAPSWLEQLKWFQYIVFVLESLPLCSNCVKDPSSEWDKLRLVLQIFHSYVIVERDQPRNDQKIMAWFSENCLFICFERRICFFLPVDKYLDIKEIQ